MNFGKHVALFFATGFYIGYMPIAPGTFGSLLGLPIWFVLSGFAPAASFVFLSLFIPFAVYASRISSRMLNQKDPGSIVIDEAAGMVVTLAGLPFSWTTCCFGFIIFRFLDIVKPHPIRWVDDNIGGGTGIVLDDILAGIIANITLRIVF